MTLNKVGIDASLSGHTRTFNDAVCLVNTIDPGDDSPATKLHASLI
jgi:hypothetical protein